MKTRLTKIVVVVGPTASGKTALAIELAKRFNGEVISADSRQVYRGLDIGTGKVTDAEMDGVPHHLIDIRDPDESYSAADFVREADAAIADISARGKLPIIAGGTFFYTDALLGNTSLAEVPSNNALRAELELLDTSALFTRLAALDAAYAEKTDHNNRHRIMRAVEILETNGSMPAVQPTTRYDALIIGIAVPPDVLNERIAKRLEQHLAEGMLEETRTLHAAGLSFERMYSLGLEYRYMAEHLQGMITYEQLVEILTNKIRQYGKRQRTWLRRMENVHWIPFDRADDAMPLVEDFIETQ